MIRKNIVISVFTLVIIIVVYFLWIRETEETPINDFNCVTLVRPVDTVQSTKGRKEEWITYYVYNFIKTEPCYDKVLNYIDSFEFDTTKVQTLIFYRYTKNLPKKDFHRIAANEDIILQCVYDKDRRRINVYYWNQGFGGRRTFMDL